MLTAARLLGCRGEDGVLDLLRELGYPVAPVDVDPLEWKRGGVPLPWNGETRLRLAARMRDFDLFLLKGHTTEESVAQFMRNYADYNIATKSALVSVNENKVALFDLSRRRELRRLDIDLARPSTHALDRLNLLAVGEGEGLPRVFDRALDREGVTRQFFRLFRGALEEIEAALCSAHPDEEADAVRAEALLILSRLLFLSFVQEKGWLGGERRFLVDRLEREMARGGEFFADVLLPLFFGCLNTPHDARSSVARRLGRVPYLNGGLFEPSSFERRNRELHLPNELMQRVLEGVFERFDFSVDENDGAGTHVDPEMLGKVFETLMETSERAASGSFYTPKEVVDVLTADALDAWLGDVADAAAALERLESITVLDPACGSGAFLLSALCAIEKRWRELAHAAGREVPRDLRRRIVARSLFGVDLKAEAVRLCELRLWLAIVSDSDDTIESVEPLPNLDRNILQGNSLLSPTDFLGDARGDLYRDWLVALRAQRDLIERYRTASNAQRPAIYRVIRGNDQRFAVELLARAVEIAERELQVACAPQRDLFGRMVPIDAGYCRSLQNRAEAARRMLERAEEGSLDFFSFDVHFAHVMAAGGFDLVIGNPPWVRNGRIDPSLKRMCADRYSLFRGRGDAGFHQPDLSVAFVERSFSLASSHGVVALLLPAKVLNAGYASGLRRKLHDEAAIVALSDWSDDPRRHRWFAADTFPLALVCARHAHEKPIRISSGGESFALDRELISVSSGGGEWALVPPEIAGSMRKLRERHPTLADALARKPMMGVKTGNNRAFFLDAAQIEGDHLITAEGIRVPMTAVCRCARGRDVRRWRVSGSQWMLWPPREGWKRPPRWLIELAAARGVEPEEFRLAFVRPEHVGMKVVWKDLSRRMAAAVLPDVVHVDGHAVPVVPNQTLYSLDAVSLDEAWVLSAILNSTTAAALLLATAERAKDGHYRYFGRTVAAMPFPADRSSEWNVLARQSRRAEMNSAAEREVDAAVARLYGLSSGELIALEAFLSRRLDAR